jgi:serine protease Do
MAMQRVVDETVMSLKMRARSGFALLVGGLGALALGCPLAADSDPRRDLVVEAIERVMPSVVSIATEEIVQFRDPFEELFRDFWAPYYRRRPQDTRFRLGSGVVVDEAGYILTNMHVVQRARRVWVQFADGREYEAQPRIVGTLRSDVALLQLVTREGDEGVEERFQPVRFAADDDLLLGETVLALGNPFGLGGSVSRGILSSKSRRPPREGEPLQIVDWLQTDAAINMGSSGGALINVRGEMIGLNVAVHREGQGIGFAIPVKEVREAMSEIFTPEVNRSLWFGGRLRPGAERLVFSGVQGGSPADEAGLRTGDVLRTVNGRSPRSFIEAVSWMGDSPDAEMMLEVERSGATRVIRVAMLSLDELVRQRLGMTVQELTPELARNFRYGIRDGLLIADVEAEGPAGAVDVRPGYLLAAIDGQATPNLLSAATVLAGRRPGDTVEVTVAAWQQSGRLTRLIQGTATMTVR